MQNKFGVGAIGKRISIVEELPEKMTPADALNLSAHLAACALEAQGGDIEAGLERFMESIAQAAGDGAMADRIRAELK